MLVQAAIYPKIMPIIGGFPFGAMRRVGLRLDTSRCAKEARLQPPVSASQAKPPATAVSDLCGCTGQFPFHRPASNMALQLTAIPQLPCVLSAGELER